MYYRTRLWEKLTPEYVADRAERFHFREEDIPLIEAVARVRDFGDRKYTDPENWKHIAPERWHEALLRHVLAIWNDPMHIDEESGLPSLWHVACNAAFLCAQDNQLNPFWKETPFEDTERGTGGFGRTGR